jgi:hypothetical protein
MLKGFGSSPKKPRYGGKYPVTYGDRENSEYVETESGGPRVSGRSVAVEAERSQDGSNISITLTDSVLRRGLAQRNRGVHNALLPMERLKRLGFPENLIADLEQGRPVRFHMNLAAFYAFVPRDV